jgi:3-hydroxybutyryl-CoA dehydratase
MSFQDIQVGTSSEHAVTVTAEHFAVAEKVFGDDHPIHADDAYAREHGHPSRILPGSVITGLMTRSLRVIVTDSALALLQLTVQFKAAVYNGDQLQVRWEAVEKRPKPHRGGGIVVFEGRCINQSGAVVATAEALDLIAD